MLRKRIICAVFPVLASLSVSAMSQTAPQSVLTSVDTKLLLDAAGPQQRSSLHNVFLIGCRIGDEVKFGSGFLLNNGVIITNAHVVNDCGEHPVSGVSTTNEQIAIAHVLTDKVRDLAILTPQKPLKGGYALAPEETPEAGTRVDFWGYPFGYNGTSPLLGVGYVAGYRNSKDNGGTVKHIVVNGAINHGNSGGPLLVSQSNEVIGVIVLTFHFYPPQTRQIIDVMGSNSSGVGYTSTLPDGTKKTLVESQLTAAVLDEFYNKTQIDIGEAIAASEVRDFLKEHLAELPSGMPKDTPQRTTR